MENLDQILAQNPMAAEGFEAVRETLSSLRELRELGMANAQSFCPVDKLTVTDIKGSRALVKRSVMKGMI